MTAQRRVPLAWTPPRDYCNRCIFHDQHLDSCDAWQTIFLALVASLPEKPLPRWCQQRVFDKPFGKFCNGRWSASRACRLSRTFAFHRDIGKSASSSTSSLNIHNIELRIWVFVNQICLLVSVDWARRGFWLLVHAGYRLPNESTFIGRNWTINYSESWYKR